MLYLAEVKKQTKGLISGLKTELKLLACQEKDQAWTPVTGEETISCDYLSYVGEGALLLVNLNGNKQVQGTPELAGNRLVRQLQYFSRLLEKSKQQEEDIEQWRQSLTIQSQELNRRREEINAQLEEIERKAQEFENLEEQRQEIQEAWDKLQVEEQRYSESNSQQSMIIAEEQVGKMQELITCISSALPTGVEAGFGEEPIVTAIAKINAQQGFWQNQLQNLEQQRSEAEARNREVQQQGEELKRRQQELDSTLASLQEAKRQLQLEEYALKNKQELLGRININLQTIEDLRDTIFRVAPDACDVSNEPRPDLETLENMALGELEGKVKKMEEDQKKSAGFINGQEDELTFQTQIVEELQAKVNAAKDWERLTLETQLTDEQEQRKMYEETLLGQRRNLREKQKKLAQHRKVLRRRQGIIDDDVDDTIDLEPVMGRLEEQQNTLQSEKHKLEGEIDHIRHSLHNIQEMIEQQTRDHQAKQNELKQQEESWQQAKISAALIQGKVELLQEIVGPLRHELEEIGTQLEQCQQSFAQNQDNNNSPDQALAELTAIVNHFINPVSETN